MEDIQPERLRREPLRRTQKAMWRWMAGALCVGLTSMAVAKAQEQLPPQRPLIVPLVRSGKAVLQQKARTTMFLFTPNGGKEEQIALTHPSDYPQGFNAPYAARVVAEIPDQLLVFTDTFASNPGNVQGQCGASPTGERFLHVVSLVKPGRESLSVLMESCLLDIEPRPGTPAFNSASRTLTLRFASIDGQAKTVTYHIASDNSVSR